MNKIIAKITDEDFGLPYEKLKNPRVRYASRGIVIRDDDKIALFNKRLKNEYKLPGGGSELNETKEETFIREVKEETGCIVEIKYELGTIEEYKKEINFKQISSVFVGKVVKDTEENNLTNLEKEEDSVVIWEYPEKALELIKNCIDELKGYKHEDVYGTKFVILRDKLILEYYLKHLKQLTNN